MDNEKSETAFYKAAKTLGKALAVILCLFVAYLFLLPFLYD
jgi:uncharacterized membrane protein YgaE (UPF0421/DUF939 family)